MVIPLLANQELTAMLVGIKVKCATILVSQYFYGAVDKASKKN